MYQSFSMSKFVKKYNYIINWTSSTLEFLYVRIPMSECYYVFEIKNIKIPLQIGISIQQNSNVRILLASEFHNIGILLNYWMYWNSVTLPEFCYIMESHNNIVIPLCYLKSIMLSEFCYQVYWNFITLPELFM